MPAPRNDPRKRERPEQALQIACVQWADLIKLPLPREAPWPLETRGMKIGRFLYHVANGGARSRVEAGIFQAMGVRAGVPDLVLALPVWWPGSKAVDVWKPCAGLYIEMKAPGQDLSFEQQDWIQRLELVGYETAMVDSVDKFQRVVTLYLGRARPLWAPP